MKPSQSPVRSPSGSKDKTLFTPGPLTTSTTVKQAMLRDLGSRDSEFMEATQAVRHKLLEVAGVTADKYAAVLLPGSGTYSVEAVLTSATPTHGKVLIIANGAYGQRMVQIAKIAGLKFTALSYAENQLPDVREIEETLQKDVSISNVAMVHCETTSGIVNPIEEVGELAARHGKIYFVDAMSSFGGVPIDLEGCHIQYLVSSANKCLEGVPGLGFVIADRKCLMASEGWARSLSLDLFAQWRDLEQKAEFRYTPPIQALLALDRALDELEAEGGVESRSARYRENHDILMNGMGQLGFRTYLEDRQTMGYIITAYRYPEHPNFNYKIFYERMRELDVVIYSGKVSNADCFRTATLG